MGELKLPARVKDNTSLINYFMSGPSAMNQLWMVEALSQYADFMLRNEQAVLESMKHAFLHGPSWLAAARSWQEHAAAFYKTPHDRFTPEQREKLRLEAQTTLEYESNDRGYRERLIARLLTYLSTQELLELLELKKATPEGYARVVGRLGFDPQVTA